VRWGVTGFSGAYSAYRASWTRGGRFGCQAAKPRGQRSFLSLLIPTHLCLGHLDATRAVQGLNARGVHARLADPSAHDCPHRRDDTASPGSGGFGATAIRRRGRAPPRVYTCQTCHTRRAKGGRPPFVVPSYARPTEFRSSMPRGGNRLPPRARGRRVVHGALHSRLRASSVRGSGDEAWSDRFDLQGLGDARHQLEHAIIEVLADAGAVNDQSSWWTPPRRTCRLTSMT
jgi:hypothetical protein